LGAGQSVEYVLTLQDYFPDLIPGEYEVRVALKHPLQLNSPWQRFSVAEPQLRSWRAMASAEAGSRYIHVAWTDANSPPRLLLRRLRTKDLSRSFSTIIGELTAPVNGIVLSSAPERRAGSQQWLALLHDATLDLVLTDDQKSKMWLRRATQDVSGVIDPLLIEPDRVTDSTGFLLLIRRQKGWEWLVGDASGHTLTRPAGLDKSVEIPAVAHGPNGRAWVAWGERLSDDLMELRVKSASGSSAGSVLTDIKGDLLALRASFVGDVLTVVALSRASVRSPASYAVTTLVTDERLREPTRTEQALSDPPSVAVHRATVAMSDKGPWIGLWGKTGDRSIYAPSGARIALDSVPKTPQDMLVDGAEGAFLVTWTDESGWQITRLHMN
jgi:hypothetical protein